MTTLVPLTFTIKMTVYLGILVMNDQEVPNRIY